MGRSHAEKNSVELPWLEATGPQLQGTVQIGRGTAVKSLLPELSPTCDCTASGKPWCHS